MSASAVPAVALDPESRRLQEDGARTRNWKRFGPYLAERQWGTVREDYSEHGNCWDYFPHDHARSRAYRWGEDGLLGFCDRQGRMCFGLALWNGKDPILKERLFGLTGPEGNHGEDVKELYYYLDSTPTHSYCKALYKYPQRAYPYAWLVEENRRRGKDQAEFELTDTGVFDEDRYFDVQIQYAKATPEDVLILITVANRGPEAAPFARPAHAVVSQHLVLGPRRRGSGKRSEEWPAARPEGARPACRQRAPAGDGSVQTERRFSGGRTRALALHRERDQPEASLWQPESHPLRQGRVPRLFD